MDFFNVKIRKNKHIEECMNKLHIYFEVCQHYRSRQIVVHKMIKKFPSLIEKNKALEQKVRELEAEKFLLENKKNPTL